MKTNTIENILEIGTNLILQKGYNHVGLQEILKTANIPKGSFYHYFKSKEDFGIKVIQYYSKNSLDILETYLSDQKKTPKERIISFFTDMRNVYQQKSYNEGCLLGNCSLELSDLSDAFSQAIASEFALWQTKIENCVAEGQETKMIKNDESAEDMANYILTTWEGSLLRMKSAKSGESIDVFIHYLSKYIL